MSRLSKLLLLGYVLGLVSIIVLHTHATVQAQSEEVCTHQIGAWQSGAPIPGGHIEGSVATANGKLYVLGGYSDYDTNLVIGNQVHVYNPATNTWQTRNPMPFYNSHDQSAVDGQYIWIAGGFLGAVYAQPSSQVWRYNTVNDTWQQMVSLPSPRASGAFVRVGRELHYIGGLVNRKTMADTHFVLDLDNPTQWVTRPALPRVRNHIQAVAIDNVIYISGGEVGHDGPYYEVDWVDSYDNTTGVWSELASLPYTRSHYEGATLAANGRFIIMSGRSEATHQPTLDSILEYNPATDTWINLPPLPKKLYEVAAAVIDGKLIVTAGGNNWNEHQFNTWFADFSLNCDQPPTNADTPVYRINSGGPAVTTGGVTWLADQYYDVGNSNSYSISNIYGTTDDVLYNTERSSTSHSSGFSYQLPVPSGDYKVQLHFAEDYWTSANQRQFSVLIEGQSVLNNYDIVADVGTHTATIKTFDNIAVTDGTLNIDFPAATLDRPKISAIEVFTTGDPPPPPPPDGTCGPLTQEAENAALAGQFSIGYDANASGGQYITTPDLDVQYGYPSSTSATFCFNVTTPGQYRLKGWVYADSYSSDSFWVDMGNQTGIRWDVRFNASYLEDYVSQKNGPDPVIVTLAAGENYVTIYGRDDGTRLDRVQLELIGGPPPPPPPDGTCGPLTQEAEDAALAGQFSIANDANASGGQYITTPDLDVQYGYPSSNSTTFCFDVETAGDYRLKTWVYADSYSSDSFWVDMGDQTGIRWDVRYNTGYLEDYVSQKNGPDPVIVTLAAGENYVTIYGRDDGTRLDRVQLELIGGTPPPPPPSVTCGALTQEAEDAALAGQFSVGYDANASGGQYITTPDIDFQYSYPSSTSATFCFDVTTPGEYRLKGWVYADSYSSDSFWVDMGDQAGIRWDVRYNTGYLEDSVSQKNGPDPVIVTLAAGENYITIYGRDDGTRLDRVELSYMPPGKSLVLVPYSLRVSGDLNRGSIRPQFEWTLPAVGRISEATDWFNLVLADANNQIILDQWLNSDDVCLENSCRWLISPENFPVGLTNGSYRWWLRSWQEGVYSGWSDAGQFDVNVPTPEIPAITGTRVDSGYLEVLVKPDESALWYHVVIATPTFDIVGNEWIEKPESCDAVFCAVPSSVDLVNGNYLVYLQSWGSAGHNNNDENAWSDGMSFTLDLAASAKVQALTATLTPEQTTLRWAHSAGATWYNIWVGTSDYQQTLEYNWYPQAPTCEDNICTLILPGGTVSNVSNFTWFVKAWGPGGFSENPDLDGWTQGNFSP